MDGLPTNMKALVEQAQQMQQKLMDVQAEAEKNLVEASAGGGMVTATVNGKQEVVSLNIDKSVVNPDDIEMLQDLVSAAVNEGLRKSKDSLKAEMGKLTGGLSIPGFS